MSDKELEKHIDKALAKYFYGKIISTLLDAELKLVEEEQYEGAAIVRDEILKLQKELQKEINE